MYARAARRARLRLVQGAAPARAPFLYLARQPRVPVTVALACPYTGLRYLARCATAEARYEDAGGRHVFTHAFIAEGYRGRGLSWTLMRGVLEDLKQRHITVTNYRPVLDASSRRTLSTLR